MKDGKEKKNSYSEGVTLSIRCKFFTYPSSNHIFVLLLPQYTALYRENYLNIIPLPQFPEFRFTGFQVLHIYVTYSIDKRQQCRL